MKTIRKKTVILVLIVCCMLFCTVAIFLLQKNRSSMSIAKAQEISENTITDSDDLSSQDVIAVIEEDMQARGTSISAVLQSQRDSYMNELGIVSDKERDIVLAKIDVLDKEIELFEKTDNFSNNFKSLELNNNAYAAYPFEVSPNCICNASNYIIQTPCGACIEYTDKGKEVSAIAAGFAVREWSLAADLMLFNMSNTTLDIDYWPERGGQIAQAPQIANELAYNSELARSFRQDSPGRLNGLFESTIEGDTYNALGAFWYSKTDAGDGNVNISIIDRYDWHYINGDSASVFNNTLVRAQEIGVVTPFYTRIDLTIPGYIPFNWKYIDTGVEITDVASGTTAVNYPEEIFDVRIRPNPSRVYITSIAFNAFSEQTEIPALTLPDTVTRIGNKAFSGCTNLTSIVLPENVTTIGANAFEGCSSLENITIHAGLTDIGVGVFSGCSNLNISVAADNPNYSTERNILYNKDKTKIISTGDISTNITIPETITEIGAYSFYENDNLEKLYIKGIPAIQDFAFYGCENLNGVYFYSYIIPVLGMSTFANDEFTLYVPHSKQAEYEAVFSGYVDMASSIPVTISFNSEGIVIDTLNTYYGAIISSLPQPFKEGYNFAGWYNNSEFTGEEYVYDEIWDTAEDTTAYAKWSPQTYYIYFSGYGSEKLEDKEVKYDAPIGMMPNIEKEGYTFYGWKNEHGEYFMSDTIWRKLNNQTVSPDLRANQYTITYNGNGGTTSKASQTVEYDKVINSLATAYLEGYTFNGWNTYADGSGETIAAPYTYNISDDITLYAQYTANQYNVTFDKQGGSGGSEGVNATYGSQMPTGTDVVAPTKSGYTFQGYFSMPRGAGTKYYNNDMSGTRNWDLLDDTTLFAYWIANQYRVTFDKQGGSGGTSSIVVTYNIEMPSGGSITAPKKTGYIFQGYYQSKNGQGIKYYNSDMTSRNVWREASNSIIYAYWTPDTYTVVLQKEGGTGGSDSIQVMYQSSMPSATAPTRVGYTFQGYYSEPNGLGTKYYDENMSSAHDWDIAADQTLYAYWTGNTYTVTFNKQGGTGGSYSIKVTYGSPMPSNVSAPTRTHYVLKGFYEQPNGVGTKYYDGPDMTSVYVWDRLGNATLYADWRGEYYNIIYKNLDFQGQTAEVILDNSFLYDAPTFYEYGVGLDLTRVSAYYRTSSPYTSQLRFLGWYTSDSFTVQKTYISSSSTNDVFVYAKWRYDFNQHSRWGTYTITDEDPYTPDYYDQIWLGFSATNLYNDLREIGINYLAIEFKIKIKEVDDGYQEILIYDGLDSSSNLLWEARNIEHGPGYANKNEAWYIWTVEFNIEDLKNVNNLYVRYGAHGNKNDTWITEEIFMNIMFTSKRGDYSDDVMKFYWSDEIVDEDCILLENVSEL